MKKGLNREIIALAIPNIISNISVPLISSVDTALMGSVSALHLGAIGLGSMLFNFLYWNFSFLRMGTTGMTAQAYGANDTRASIHHLGRALLLAILFGSLMIIAQFPLQQLGFYLLQIPAAQQEMVGQYFTIRILAAPLTLSLMTFMGWYFGQQNAIYPLLITIAVNIANIVFSSVLVMHYQLGIAGVAYGTVLAQAVGVLVAVVLFMIRYRKLITFFDVQYFWNATAFGGFLRVNSDIFLRTLCLTIVFGFFYSQSAAISPEILAVNTILLQFLNWMSFGVDGFAYAAESLVGKYHGRQEPKELRRVIRLSLYWGMALAISYTVVYALFGNFLLGLFSDDVAILQAAQPYLWWMIVLPIIGTPCYIWDGIYVGLTASKSMRNTMFIALIVYFMTYYIGIYYDNNRAASLLWAALLLFLAARGVLQYIWYQKKGLQLK